MKKWILMNPGPVNVTERVRRSLLQPDICHREEEFSGLLRSIRERLLKIFGLSKTHTVAVFSGSGTTALEAMLSSFARPDRKILVLSNGVYGQRIESILKIHGTPFHALSSATGDFPKAEQIEPLLKNDPFIHGVAMVHHETSSGMLNPLERVSPLVKKYGKVFLVDAISSLGAEKIDFKKHSIDFLCGTSGKCLHGFPGASFVILSKAQAYNLKNKKPKTLYLDIANVLAHEEKDDTPFTPDVQILYAFDEALKELLEEGLASRLRSYAQKCGLLEKGFMDLRLNFLIEKKYRSHVLTALWTPASITYEKLHGALKKEGFVIYAGQSDLKGKIFRVSNLGDIRSEDLRRFLSCLKRILSKKK